jgi:transposase-like protein
MPSLSLREGLWFWLVKQRTAGDSEGMTILADIPRVTGRHRNRALAAERRSRAVEMALTGSSYQAIADQLGYANRGTVYRLSKNAVENRQAETIDELRQLEVERLDALQVAIWDDATNGDVRAVAAVVRIMHLRAKILGLYSHTDSNCPHVTKPLILW